MDLFTHFLVGAVLYTSVFGRLTTEFMYFAAIFATLPDMDTIVLRPLKRWFKSPYFEHRGGSHSYIIGFMMSFFVNLVYAPLTGNNFWLGWLIGFLFYGLHISMDLLTTTRIPFLFPLSQKEPSAYVEKAGSLFTMGISVIFLVILIPHWTSGQTELMWQFSLSVSIFFALYYLYRFLLKIIISRKLGPTQKFFPGVLPLFYLIYSFEISEERMEVNLTKFNIFGKSKTIININMHLAHAEYQLYQKALLNCNSDYYRKKWTKLPVINRENGHFSVRLFFVETVMNGRTMSIEYNYNPEDGQITAGTQEYGKIGRKIQRNIPGN